MHKKDETFLYVSEGAVGWGPRMRLLSTTEYTVVVLRSPEVCQGLTKTIFVGVEPMQP